MQIILMYCEIEHYEKVIEELIKGLAQKNPKTVAGCINNMTDCLKAFGAKVIKVSPLLKAIVPLLDHRDKPVRDEGKAMIVEAYRLETFCALPKVSFVDFFCREQIFLLNSLLKLVICCKNYFYSSFNNSESLQVGWRDHEAAVDRMQTGSADRT